MSTRLILHRYPAVQHEARVLPVTLKHGAALLAYLSEQGQAVGRDALAALLWPDASVSIGRARLRRLAHHLQQALGLALLDGRADTLRLADGVTSDVQATRRATQALARPGRLDEQALGRLLRADAARLLHGFTLGSEAFDDWLDAQRRGHQAAVTRALEAAAERALTARRTDLAKAIADALLQIDPCHEAAHATRMAARAIDGEVAGVETAFLECAERLRDELGLRPSARLEAAYVAAAGRARGEPKRLEIGYAPTRHGLVAHAAWGRGEDTIVVLWGLLSNLEVALEEPRARAFLDRLAQHHRIVMFDRRGTGLSERVGIAADAHTTGEDITAVLDHLGIDRAWLFGSSVGGTLALDFAHRQPLRTRGLLLWGTSAAGAWTADTPWALKPEAVDAWVARLTDPRRYDEGLETFAPSAARDPWVRDWYARLLRHATSRLGAVQMLRQYQAMDLRALLPGLRVPTLVMQRRGDRLVPVQAARQIADAMPRARLELLDGDDHFLWHGDSESVLRVVQSFTGVQAAWPLAA